ncbi:serine/threonine-protein kinase/endoribonuclease IRE1 [Daphnia magna]|uniref:serine/threonine-protein kinase/endoribonuclease IRE1 n=1 Tax=Daphnia magna TaxID=35525 RepID=UPI001E1BC006|nr:serine/threonine-protein kinase/endoribonuclease IRE1 [Daphnia magna]XP_045033309.1 serine/threonine-protein kinase/endoribonuclease IRE1 [Daphnia magna]
MFAHFFSSKRSQPTMKFDKENVLGRGFSAQVFSGTFNGKDVAVKRIEKSVGLNLDKAAQELEEETMKNLDHPNVLKLLHVQDDNDFKYLILELCVGTIANYVNGTYKGEMPSEIEGMIQMASGLQYIHSKHFVHRDIKPANVLISSTFVLKISDFGLSRTVTTTSGSFAMTSGPKGTRVYYSPEFLFTEGKTKEEKEQIRVNVSIDVFSLGCLFFNYLTKGGHPFANGGRPNEVLTPASIQKGEKVLDGEMGLAKNHYAYAMIEGMTEKIPEDRWKLEKVLETLNAKAKSAQTEEIQ